MHRLQTITAALMTCATTSAHAYILIDDFTLTENPALYPATAPATEPPTRREVVDTFGFVDGQQAQRRFAITPSAESIAVPSSGEQTADLIDGTLRFTTNGGFGFVYLEWIGPNPTRELNIDASGEAGILIDYTTNVTVDVLLQLWTFDGARPAAGNNAVIQLLPNQNRTFIPFEDIDLIAQIGEGHPSTGIEFRDAPPVDLTKIDQIALWIADLDQFDIARPLDHDISFRRLALVPEPSIALGGVVAIGAAIVYRRGRA